MTEETLFERAVQLAESERAAFLDRECAGQPDLRARVEALLAADAASQSPLDRPVAVPERTGECTPEPPEPDDPPGPTASYHGPVEQEGNVIAGKYTLVEVIGEGGMGSVWRARQTEPVKRFVAVKLIKAGMDSRQVLARFDAERQALALMDHPNIAKVLDGGIVGQASSLSGREAGSLPHGRPFFVMELVKGVPITQYCDQHKLTPPQRLELFVQACQAIQHAHQKGIIHRDIKPSNVLVALYDDKPVVKVIDFGVAKATGGTLTEATIDTGFGGVVGTPQYMSPEQATFNNLDIDTRSDVYALGVLLYELLAGSPPFSGEELKKKGFLEILRVVREEEPPRPSAKLSTADALPSLSANRGTEPKKLTGLLRNELDWIVMKALEKDRTRRYETANGFAADVQRYLAGEPVLAHPPSTAYRLRMFVRRNRPQVIAASLVLLALLAGMIGTTLGLLEAKRQEGLARKEATAKEQARQAEAEERQKAESAKVEAQAKEAEANAVVKFFEEQVFAAARPEGQDGGQGAAVTLRDALAASVPALVTSFTAQPQVEARLRMALGLTFSYLAEHEQARRQVELARDLRARHLGPDHPDTLRSMGNLANSYADLNRPAEALKLREEVLEIQKRVLPQDHPDTLVSMNNLAISYAALNRPAEALKLREEVLEIQQRVLPQDHPDTLTSMHNLALSYTALNRPAEALKLGEEVLEILKRVLPQDHPDTLLSMMGLASSYIDADRGTEALALIDEFLPMANLSGVDPSLLPLAIGQRLAHFREADDPAGCRATAEMWEKLNLTDADSLYDAACLRAVTAAVQAKTPGTDADRLAKEDADKAMDWLHKAVEAGWKDADHMNQDTDLDFLRDREDFKMLLEELAVKK